MDYIIKKMKNTEGSGDEPKDGSDGTDDTKGDAEGDEVKKGSSSYNPNGAGGDGSDNQITHNETPTTKGNGEMSDRQKKQLDNAIEKQKQFQMKEYFHRHNCHL